MNSRICALVAAGLWVVAGAASAHHNMSALFDFNNRVSLSGTLTNYDWRNPHIYLTVEVKARKMRWRHGRWKGRLPASSAYATSARWISRTPPARW